MTPAEIFDHIECIAATASKNEKRKLLSAAIGDSLFLKVMVYAYDPFKRFGIRQVPTGVADGSWPGLEHADVWSALDGLAARELTGDNARATIQEYMDKMDHPSAELLWRILRKDMRAGFSEDSVNAVGPGTLPEFPYMRGTLPQKSNMEKWDWAIGIISQTKADGSFANVNRGPEGDVWITSRQGSPYQDGVLGIEDALAAAFGSNTQTHGELVVYQDGVLLPRKTGNGILNSLLQGGRLQPGQQVHYFAWDQIPLEAVKPKGKHDVPYKARLARVIAQVLGKPHPQLHVIPTRVVDTKAAAQKHFQEQVKLGREGTMVKHPGMPWRDTSGNKDMVKFKMTVTVELRIKGFMPGEGKNAATFGSLVCESECGQLKVNVSGFDDATRCDIHENRQFYLEEVIAVSFNEVIRPKKDGEPWSLFLPRWEEHRLDKAKADTLEQIRAQVDAVVQA